MNADHRARLIASACHREEDLDVTRVSLLVASQEYPGLDVPSYEARLETMGRVFARRAGTLPAEEAVLVLSEYLFEEEGFRGNGEDYYDPRNGFLNEVMDRRMGIPITLSTIYLDVARRAGLRAFGVSFPGHFLVRVEGDGGPLLLDPFHGGIRLTMLDCKDRLDRVFGGGMSLAPEMLEPCSKRAMVVRLLRNLENIYVKTGDHARALRTVEVILLVDPVSSSARRDRGLILAAMGCYGLAADALQSYLDDGAAAAEASMIVERIEELRSKAARIN